MLAGGGNLAGVRPDGGIGHSEPDLFRCSHRVERARHHLRGPGTADLVAALRFEQFGVREDDAELVVEAVEEQAEIGDVIHLEGPRRRTL